jgi:hypothetical protein
MQDHAALVDTLLPPVTLLLDNTNNDNNNSSKGSAEISIHQLKPALQEEVHAIFPDAPSTPGTFLTAIITFQLPSPPPSLLSPSSLSATPNSNDKGEGDFSLSKAPDDALTTIIHATYTNAGAIPLKNFTFQAAVPKYMTIKLEPASEATLPAGGAGSVTQVMHVKNTMHGQKKLVMRLRLVFTREDQQMLEQGEVSNFPAAF